MKILKLVTFSALVMIFALPVFAAKSHTIPSATRLALLQEIFGEVCKAQVDEFDCAVTVYQIEGNAPAKKLENQWEKIVSKLGALCGCREC
ncbi:hypothetical protein WDW86_11145 [Bdellovibrionota bacterium FG-2]